MNQLIVLSCVIGVTGIGVGAVIQMTATSQVTCALPHTASSLFKTEPVPLTGYKSY